MLVSEQEEPTSDHFFRVCIGMKRLKKPDLKQEEPPHLFLPFMFCP